MIRRVVYNTLVLHYDCGLVPKEKDYQVGSLNHDNKHTIH